MDRKQTVCDPLQKKFTDSYSTMISLVKREVCNDYNNVIILKKEIPLLFGWTLQHPRKVEKEVGKGWVSNKTITICQEESGG